MNRDEEMSIEQKAIIAKAMKPVQDMAEEMRKAMKPVQDLAEEMRKAMKPTLDAMKLLSSKECATSLRKRRSHRNFCQVRAESIYGLKRTLAEVVAQWAKKTTDIQDPPNEVLSSSQRNHGPPSRLVRELSNLLYSLTPVGQGQGEPQR